MAAHSRGDFLSHSCRVFIVAAEFADSGVPREAAGAVLGGTVELRRWIAGASGHGGGPERNVKAKSWCTYKVPDEVAREA